MVTSTMAIRALLLFCLVFYLSHIEKIEGGHRKLSMKEELEIEKELKRLNKPAFKTIRTQFGDVYDCIDFYKQPAFDHPLLKNHTYHHQMRPIAIPVSNNERKKAEKSMEMIQLLGGGCPAGTVPIRRHTKEDLIRIKLSGESNGVPLRSTVRTDNAPLQTKYYGGTTFISVYNPTVVESQYSSALMAISNGNDRIEAGWTVNPTLYGDHETHIYIHTKTRSSGCFNTDCPGFIIVSTEMPLDAIISPTSTRGGTIYICEYAIYQDLINGNWWLEVEKKIIGFWPKRIFTDMQESAFYVEWGGEANCVDGLAGPGMGSSNFPMGDYKQDAYCKAILVYNATGDYVDPGKTQVIDESPHYSAWDEGQYGNFGHFVEFGGPGPH